MFVFAKRYVRWESLNPKFSFARPFVLRKIIKFSRKYMRAARMFASFDETQQWFLATSKVNPHLTRLATGKRTFRDPFLDPVLVTFFNSWRILRARPAAGWFFGEYLYAKNNVFAKKTTPGGPNLLFSSVCMSKKSGKIDTSIYIYFTDFWNNRKCTSIYI